MTLQSPTQPTPLNRSEVKSMAYRKVQQFLGNSFHIQGIFNYSYAAYSKNGGFQSAGQRKAAIDIMNCKTAKLGFNLSQCPDCGYQKIHYCSCRNRNCPNCQAVNTELWVDQRRAEVIDAPYFHVVFTLPHELNPLLYCNQSLLSGSFTSALPEHFWNYARIKNISEPLRGSSRFFIHGTRSLVIMYICTVLSLAAD